MEKLSRLFARLWRRPGPVADPLLAALAAFRDPAAAPLELIRQLVAVLRPQGRSDRLAGERHRRLVALLEADPELCAAFRGHLMHFVATCKLLTFFTDSGILPGTGFFSEWWRILWKRVLPEALDERRLKDCLNLVYDRADDWRWQAELPDGLGRRFWALMTPPAALAGIDWRQIREQLLDAVLLLAHRVSGLGVDGELMRASPDIDAARPCFIALSAEALDFASSQRAAAATPGLAADDGSQLLVIAGQCREALQRIRKRARTVGTSLHLSYLLTRSEQSLDRLGELVGILNAAGGTAAPAAVDAWTAFAGEVLIAENRRNSLPFYLGQLSRLLAVRVTENAARSGEHYICEAPADYRAMWRSAAGAGALIALMALLKVKAAALHAPLFVEALMFSLIYGLGFVLIYLLGLTIATKQPAMTAQTLAGLLGEIRPRRGAEVERVVDVVAAVSRSQLAAIAGNVALALPVALLVSLGYAWLFGQPPVAAVKAQHLLADLDPLSWAIPHAAIAGFYLFLAGLCSGYFDNQAAYAEVGSRIARLRWLNRLAGRAGAGRIGQYIQEHLGGIMGNFLFGCMLGSTGVLGIILGLPLDIRHIAFASANLGYASAGLDFALSAQTLLWAALGIAAIGLTNLAVSFALALRTALGARRVRFAHWGPLLAALGQRLRTQPRSFVLPPPAL